MNIIEEIREREKMYKKKGGFDKASEVMNRRGVVSDDSLLYRTSVNFNYFKEFMEKRFPDLQLVRLITVISDYTPCFYDCIWNNNYNIEYVMINKKALECFMVKEDNYVMKDNMGYVIIIYQEKYKKRNIKREEILSMCPIILLYNNIYHDDVRISRNYFHLDKVTGATFPKSVSLYPEGMYGRMEETRFLLYANSLVISQKRLDNICMAMLRELYKEADKEISKEIFIYENIRKKLLDGIRLDNDEWGVVLRFLNSEEDRIRSKHTLLKRSLIKMEDKK